MSHIYPNFLVRQSTSEGFSEQDIGEFRASISRGGVGGGTVVEGLEIDSVFWGVFMADGRENDDSRGLGGDDPV